MRSAITGQQPYERASASSSVMSACERGQEVGSADESYGDDQQQQQHMHNSNTEKEFFASQQVSQKMAVPIARPIEPEGTHETNVSTMGSKSSFPSSLGAAAASPSTSAVPPVEVEMSSLNSGSGEEEDSSQIHRTPSKNASSGTTMRDHRRYSGTRIHTVGGTLSFDAESGDESDAPLQVGLSVSPTYRQISFFPTVATVDEADEDEDEDSVDPLMTAFDYLEDEVDGHVYDDLVPLPVRLALEENVFGWSHLFSDIFGHILYTAGGYSITFWFITWLLLRRVPGAEGGDGGCDGGAIECAFYRRTPPDYEPILGISFEAFVVLRGIMSTFSAINAFRTVRRRKRVWLRNDYGSTAYKSDATRRRMYVEETDRNTFLGRLRSGLGKRREGYLMKKLRKKLQKATDRFERRHRSRMRRMNFHGAVDTAESHHNRVKALATERTKDRALQMVTDTPRGGSSGHERAGGVQNSRSCSINESIGSINASSCWQSHTMAAAAMRSVQQDQIPFRSGEIQSIPYAHGGFFGAAPFMLANPFWIDVLRALMPDVYVEISRRITAPVPRLIHWAENNPVVAAFGTAHEMEFSGRVSTLEWDVFLDPHLVRRVEIVLEERDKFLSRCVSSRSMSHHVDITAHGTCHAEALLDDPSEKATLQYYNAEIRRRTVILVERMLIAHGNLTQLILEQTGFAKKYNFSRVRRTRRTLGGGIYARQWLAVYAEALRMGMGYFDDSQDVSAAEIEDTDGYFSDSSVELQSDSEGDPSAVDEGEEEDTPLLPSPLMEGRKGIQSTGSGSGENDRASPSKYDSFSRSASDASFRKRTSNRESPRTRDATAISKSKATTASPLPRRKRQSLPGTPIGTPGNVTPVRPTAPSISNHRTLNALAMSAVPETTIVESIALLKEITRCNAPLGLVLDIKSRHISHRVWALVIDALRDAGARVEGIASFTISEIRDISAYCSSPCNEIYFFHSAGDIQQACYKDLLKRGDKVFFNAGSLLWHKKEMNFLDPEFVKESLMDFVYFNGEEYKQKYCLQPYARITRGSDDSNMPTSSLDNNETASGNNLDDGAMSLQGEERDGLLLNANGFPYRGSSIQDYKDHFSLSMGLYVQEFAIDDSAIDFIVDHVNKNSHVYNLGLSWGGVNGVTVRGVQPDRFTNTDGFWNQRYAGASWDPTLTPTSIDQVAANSQSQGPHVGLD